LKIKTLKISLVTPSYNHGKFIARTIDSVLAQRGDFTLEYVVRDGASTDGTIDILRTYGDQIHWISERDQGQVAAINEGLKAATGDIVGWLNSDDVLMPGALHQVSSRFREDVSTIWLHGDCRVIDQNDREVRGWLSTYKRYQANRYSGQRLLANNFISQMTVFWQRDALGIIGYLDESLPLAFDYDYWLRLSQLSAPAYIPAPIASFRWYSTSKSGANVSDQCREDIAIAIRHGLSGTRLHFKRVQNRLRRFVYLFT